MYDYSENHAIFTVITKGVQTTDVGFPNMVQQQSPETQQNQWASGGLQNKTRVIFLVCSHAWPIKLILMEQEVTLASNT